MINLSHNSQAGYYDMDSNMVIGENSSETDVLNSTPFSVRNILNIDDQNSEENSYQAMNMNDNYVQKYYGAGQFANGGQYKRFVME